MLSFSASDCFRRLFLPCFFCLSHVDLDLNQLFSFQALYHRESTGNNFFFSSYVLVGCCTVSIGVTVFEITVIPSKLKLRKIIPSEFSFLFLELMSLTQSRVSAVLMYEKIPSYLRILVGALPHLFSNMRCLNIQQDAVQFPLLTLGKSLRIILLLSDKSALNKVPHKIGKYILISFQSVRCLVRASQH